MNIILTGVKVQQDVKTLSFRKNNLVDVINITVDTDESWEYKLDVEYPVNRTTGQKLYNVIDLVRNGNVCSVVLTDDMLPFNGKYIMQLRGISSDKVYHTDTFEAWVKYSIDVGDVYNPVPSEFYQIEDNITEMNNHPPYPGDNGKWMIWDVDKHEYVESDIDVVGGGGGDYQTKDNLTTSITAESTNEQYPSAKATYDYGQSIVSLGLSGASAGQSPAVKTVDGNGKPTAWEAAVLAKADGSNVPFSISVQNTWQTRIAALPGIKVYGKVNANGKIMAYIDAACTQETTVLTASAISNYGNALLIYDHKTYQCVGFEESASVPGYYLTAVLSRSEIATDSAGVTVLKVETAKLNILDYLSDAINAPITITVGELPMSTTTTI